jgi:hypothetical protein
MEEQLLKDYVATYLNPNYNRNWDVVNSKFPELSGVDKQLLKDYVATYLNPTYKGDWNVVNSKFPELFVVEQPKKKEDTVSQSSAGGLVLPKSNVWTQDKERDFSGLEVQVKDETILNKKPRETKPIVSGESTKVVSQRIPQKEQQPDKIDEKLQQVQKADFDKKVEAQKVSTPLSYSNIFAKTIADLPSDLGETWSVASAFIERQLGKAGVPGANKDLKASDIYFYQLSDDWRNFTDEVYPTNKEDRDTFIGGVAAGLGQVVPMMVTGGVSMASKGKFALDLAKNALNTGTKLTPFIKLGKDIAKQAASPSGLIGGSQAASSYYRDAIESGATEDQAQQFALENFFVGTVVESLPIQSMFSRISKLEPTADILRILKEGVVGGAEETVTEMWQTTYENMSAQRIYDVNREMLDGVGEAGAVGGTVGFILNSALAALTGRRARVKTDEEKKIIDKSISEVQAKINTVNKNNENISAVADELESIEPIVLKYGDSDFTFLKDKTGKMEFASEPMTEEQAVEVANFFGKTYKSVDFLVDEIESSDPYSPTQYKIVAMEKAADKGDSSLIDLSKEPTYKVNGNIFTADEMNLLIDIKSKEELLAMDIQIENDTAGVTERLQEVIGTTPVKSAATASYTIDGAKMDRSRFVAAVEEANNEEALNELETTDPEVQKVIDSKRARLTGKIQTEVQPTAVKTPETTVEAVAETQPVTINVADKYTVDEVERVKTLPIENEDGATMNLDGTKYEKGGVVIPLASRNMAVSELTPQKIDEFVKENSESIGSDMVKVGIYKFPNSDQASIDINIVADRSRRDEAIEIARELGQESIFDLDTFENIKTGADGKNPKVLTPKEFLAIQDRLSKPKQTEITVTPETSSNYANMTEDNEGNFVFFHVGKKGYDTIKKGTGASPVTSREEASALSKVGGLAMYYTAPEQTERQSADGAKYAVKVPKNKVYDFNTDKLNLIDEARQRHESENPGKAFDTNSQIAYVTKIAGEKGFDMVVADWAGGTRAQTTKELTPVDVQESTGNVIKKNFDKQYESNKTKGFTPVVPKRKADKLQAVYDKINEVRNAEKRYDNLYSLYTDSSKYTQEEITDLIDNSDLPQDIKNEYNEIIGSKEETRRSERPIKSGVDELFKENPELASIGTTKEYSDYLDTIFPDSEVNNIAYHGSNYKFDNFKKAVNPKNVYKGGAYKAGFFFSKDKETAKSYIDNKIIAKISNALNLSAPKNPTVYPVVLDIKNPVTEDRNGERGIGFDEVNKSYDNKNDAYIAENVKDPNILTDVYVVFKPEQIHILGSKKDIEDFKKFVNEKPAKAARARLSSGVEQEDTRTKEEDIVKEIDELAERMPEKAAFEEVQEAEKQDVGEAVSQNPTPNKVKKGFLKKALDFLGLTSESQLYRKIEDFAGVPMMIGISDTLGSGQFKDSMGNPMDVDGGLLFNFFRNRSLAWANVDKKYAENLVKQAKQVYESNKELFDRLWKEGVLPDGHVPYSIVRMGDDALYSNEAVFRYLSPWVKTLPLENRKAAIDALKEDLGKTAKKQTGINWIFELQENIDNGSIENFEGLLSYVKDLKSKELSETARKSVESLETQLKKLSGDEALSNAVNIISEILDKKAPVAVLNFIEKNNITTVDELFDAISEDAVKRAKADPNNKSDLSLPLRAFISTKIFSIDPSTSRRPSSPFSKALLGNTKNPLWNDIDKLTLPYLRDQISEPTMLNARPGDIVAIMGIDVRDGSAGVERANHNNYGFGPKGRLIAYLNEPVRAFDVFAELKAKAPRLFKPNKSGIYPSPQSVIRQAGGVAYVDVPFRGARLLPSGITDLDIIIGKLRTAFPEVGVFTTKEEFDQFLKQEGIRSRKDKKGNVIYGITKDGKVFLNPENKSLRTPIHEFAHIWIDYLRSKASGKRGDELLAKGINLADGTQEYQDALEKYGERELALEEALVELIATKGDTIVNASKKSKFKNWLNALFNYIKQKFVSTKDLFDPKKTDEVAFKKFVDNMTVDDFMNTSIADLFGMEIVNRKFKAAEASTSAKARMSLGKIPARINDQINKIIAEQKALGKTPSEVAKETIKFLKSTDSYNNLGDRDKAKAIDGVKRLSGVKVRVVSSDEYSSLRESIKSEAKKAATEAVFNYKESLNSLIASVRSLVKAGKISTFKAGVIISRIANTNLRSPQSVNKTLDYIEEIFDSANLAMKVSRAKSLAKNAKRNIKSKIGSNPDLFTAAKVLLSIDPTSIPTPFIDSYLEVMEVIGERARTLSIKDAGDLAEKMNVIINAVIKEAEAQAKAAEESKVNETPKEPKVKETPETSAKKAESLIKQILSEELNTSKVLDPSSSAIARKIASINRQDLTGLLSVDKDGIVDSSKLNLLLGIRDNIKAGIVTNEAMNLATTVAQNRNVSSFSKVLPKITGASILNGVTRTLGEVKGLITKTSGVLQSIRSTGTFSIDDVIGNFNDNTINKITFGKLASAKGKLDASLSDRAAKADAAESLFKGGVGLGPVQFSKRTDNDVVKAKYKVQILLLQKEFDSNPGSESVAPAIDFINATLKAINRKESSLTKNDARILREIKTEFPSKDADGNETLNFEKIEESLTDNDKKAMKLIEEINSSTAEQALFTSAVIRGSRVGVINNYVHHAVIGTNIIQQAEELVNRLLGRSPGGKPSTKAGTLNERTPGAKAIVFDPVFSSMKGARETLTDFYMTPVIREVTGTLNKIKNNVFDDPNSTEAQRNAVQAMLEAVNESLEITFQNHFGEDSFGEAALKAIQKLGYQSMLASVPRAGAEYLSNLSYAVLSDPVTTAESIKMTDFAYSTDMLGFLEVIGSSESTRLAGNQMLTSKYAEGGFASGYGRTSKSAASSKIMDYASFIGDMTVGNVYRTNDVIADLIVSTPDKSISKPYYAQYFVNKFNELTGIKLSKSDLRNIANGTSEYLSPKYEDAIATAREDADLAIVRMAGSTNSFNTILKNVPRKTDQPWTAAYRSVNAMMARFYLTEYSTVRSAVIALFKTGQISRGAAVGLLAASVTRMSMYLVAFGVLKHLFDTAIANLFDLEEPEEEDDLFEIAKRSIVGSGVNLLTRRTIGNIPFIPISFGIEYLNEEYGEDYGLRDGEYDPYKNSLVFSKISSDDLYTKSPWEIFGRALSGPFSPLFSSAFRAGTLVIRANKEGSKPETKKRAMDELTERMTLEAAGNAGLVPFYKDIRRIMMNDFYQRNYDKKESSSFTITEKQIDLIRKSNPRGAQRLKMLKDKQKDREKKNSDRKKETVKRRERNQI